MSAEPTEPTSDECNARARVFENDHVVGYAMWYPQMGGYGGKALAMFDKEWTETGAGAIGGCIDVYVWHDGSFPFSEDGLSPRRIHHCDPKQFVEFGNTLARLNAKGRKTR